MSSAPANQPRKPSTTFFIVWGLSMFLMFYMFQNQPKQPQVPIEDLMVQLRTANAETRDVSAASLEARVIANADSAVKEGKMKFADAERLKFEATVLTAQTEMRAGVMRAESDRLRLADARLWRLGKGNPDAELWKVTKFKMHPDPRFAQIPSEATPAQLLQACTKILSDRNQQEKVWGFFPGYKFIDFLVGLTGKIPGFSYWFATFLLAVVVRSIIFKFAAKTILHGRRMGQLAPLQAEVREQFKDDPQEMQKRTMALYQEYGINPLKGCASAFIQMPLFLLVYQSMIQYQFEFQKGFFLWINPATSAATKGFIAPNLGIQDTILIILYGISMMVSQLMMPVSDPAQKKQMRILNIVMPIIFVFFMFTGAFPVVSGFVLYWTFTNVLATAQTMWHYRQPLPPLQKVNTNVGGVYPTDAASALFPWLKPVNPVADGNPAHSEAAKNVAPKPTEKESSSGKPKQHKPKKK